MNTQNVFPETERKDLGKIPGAISTQDTVEQRVSPSPPFQQPPRQPLPPPSRGNRWTWFAVVAVALVLLLSLGMLLYAQVNRGSNATPTPQVTVPAQQPTAPAPTQNPGTPAPTQQPTVVPGEQTPAPVPSVKWGPQACPAVVNSPARWAAVIGIKDRSMQISEISCANIIDSPTLQVMVTVRHNDTPGLLDVFVFDKITDPKPVQIFKLSGLTYGDAAISGYNTIMTAEVDKNSSLNKGKSTDQWQQDLFREFAWNASKGTVVQVAFPGFFPDMTRYQAEQDQRNANAGYDPWKYNAAQVARNMAVQLLQWSKNSQTRVVSGGGTHSVDAVVEVRGSGPGNQIVKVTLSRLEGNVHNIWVVIGVEDSTSLTVTNLQARSLVSSPALVEGKGGAFEAQIGKAVVLDHLYTDLGHANVRASGTGMGLAPYSTRVPYITTFNGVQEGMVVVQWANGGIDPAIQSAVIVKVLLNPASAPVPEPDRTKPEYWNPFVGAQAGISRAASVTFASMKGDSSKQALVTVYYEASKSIQEVYVFDRITDSKPVQLFKLTALTHGGAAISAYNTVMTAEVDKNSSLNKGKPANQWQQDLFREFKWDAGKGTFVQQAFPGIFPDLTRWQAVVDQRLVNAGTDTWKNDARQVAQKLAAQLLKWPTTQSSIVSGGGPHDIDAVVQLQGKGQISHPTFTVTLSRLYGDYHNIWEVIRVETRGVTITSPQERSVLNSPMTVTGNGGASYEAQIGVLYVLDHLYNPVGQGYAMGSSSGPATFTTSVPYSVSFHGGAQEGVVALYATSAADGMMYAAIMHKEMLAG